MKLIWILVLLIQIPFVSQARVFNMSKETFASYLRGSYSTSSILATPYEDVTGADESFDKQFGNSTSGEFGFVWTSPKVSFRIGIEFLGPAGITTTATDASEQELYTLRSDVTAYAPKVGLELNLYKGAESRIFLLLSGGTATVNLSNKYTFAAAGTSQFGVADFTEISQTTAVLTEANLTYETIMTDTTTISLELGFRQLSVDKLKHTEAYNSFNSQAIAKGDTVLNADGETRAFDLGGPYAGIGFRFYIK